MSTYFIEGGVPLYGEITMHGAKNAVLPILAASLLCPHSEIHNCPNLSDVDAAMRILSQLGCTVSRSGSTVTIDSQRSGGYIIADEYMREMRSSIVFLGAILAKHGSARVSFPGGCELGPRPIDLHLVALEKMGARITEDHGYLDCEVQGGRMHGAEITFSFPSVGATQNAMIAASTAKGQTVIRNGAREPEINDLAGYLNACGANIHICQDSTIIIEGVEELRDSVSYRVIPDRIATATYLCCAAITGGEIVVRDCRPDHLSAVLPYFDEMGLKLTTGSDYIALKSGGRLRAIKSVRTLPYPGFPTDAQSPLMAVTTVAEGTSVFIENIFENRYKHVTELMRMGAKIKVEGRVAVVEGVKALHSAEIQCSDLRGGAAMCVSALAAEGTSEIKCIKHIDRGYENFEQHLRALGARITRSR